MSCPLRPGRRRGTSGSPALLGARSRRPGRVLGRCGGGPPPLGCMSPVGARESPPLHQEAPGHEEGASRAAPPAFWEEWRGVGASLSSVARIPGTMCGVNACEIRTGVHPAIGPLPAPPPPLCRGTDRRLKTAARGWEVADDFPNSPRWLPIGPQDPTAPKLSIYAITMTVTPANSGDLDFGVSRVGGWLDGTRPAQAQGPGRRPGQPGPKARDFPPRQFPPRDFPTPHLSISWKNCVFGDIAVQPLFLGQDP
eukprot:gene11873-biopygen13969